MEIQNMDMKKQLLKYGQMKEERYGKNITWIVESINLFLNQVNGEKILSLVYTPSIADYMYL